MDKVLLTCPPMLRRVDEYRPLFERAGVELHAAQVIQTLPESELIEVVPRYDGWIIGDDPVTEPVLRAGMAGRLRAAVKWGVGTDNIDFAAAKSLGLPIVNTPGMFGAEVADLAVGYVLALARQFVAIHEGVKQGGWPKPAGRSLGDKVVALVGYGDIGRNTARRLAAFDMRVIAYDPGVDRSQVANSVDWADWPDRIEEADYIVFTCALNATNRQMMNSSVFNRVKPGVQVVNVARGPLIEEAALIESIATGRVAGAALDVFEVEPLPPDSPLRGFPQCLFGSHNGSNTIEAVDRTSKRATELLLTMLKATPKP